MSESELHSLKTAELEMLLEVKKICEANNICYFLIGGTLLGSVRHQGFIPWDDDIDIGMPREDYERFLAIAPQLLPSNLFLQNRFTDPEYPACYSKIRNSSTTFIEASTSFLNINHGVFIDVFPFDRYPDSPIKRRLFDFKLRLQTLRIRKVFTLDERAKRSPLAEAAINVASFVSQIVYPKVEDALNSRDEMLKAAQEGKLMANFLGAWGNKEIVPAELFDNTTESIFEGEILPIPSGWEKYLSNLYGDYMQLPPKEKQVAHHYTTAIDLNRPYTEYSNRVINTSIHID